MCIVYHLLFLSPTTRIPYHTSALTGEPWIFKLITGHPDRIRHNLVVSVEVFETLVQILHQNGFYRNGVSTEEQLGIF
ncbi:hypothetical protein M405DRAFT_752964 [Rhizopogon salebrosus TDB-379]|nr:hypothetical protein M405DRAFT_752964 [Rhizopogon salebrosus TDB-379]